MKHLVLRLITCTCLCGVFLPVWGQSYDKLWKSVDEAQKKDLPQTVISLAEKIFSKAEAEQNAAQMLKAYFMRSDYRQQISADSFYVDLKGLEAWAEQERNVSDKAVLHTLIARVYGEYALRNSEQLRKRANVSLIPDADIRTWSANQFVEKLLLHTTAAMEHNDSLFAISSERYVPFVKQHQGSRYVHHNLYHLLASYNINSLTYLYGIRTLAAQKSDDDELKMVIFSIYRKLEEYYTAHNNSDGLVMVKLDELEHYYYLRPNLTEEELVAGLDELIATYGDSEVCAEVYLARSLKSRRNRAEALRICEEAIARYPNYYRINALKNMKAEIETPYLYADFQKLGYPGEYLDLKISHRNLTGFTIHVYESRSDTLTQSWLNKVKDEKALLKLGRIVASFPFELNNKGDYSMSDTLVKWMVPHNTGLYVLRLEADGTAENRLFPVSRLRVISSQLPEKKLQVSVLDGLTGHPVSGATVKMVDSEHNIAQPLRTAVTDAAGRAFFDANNAFRVLYAEKGDDRFMKEQYLNIRNGINVAESERGRTFKIFTDRSIYRPGQMLYLKGVVYTQQDESMIVLPNTPFEVSLLDANRKTVSTQTLCTNEFGSFSGTFTIPVGGVNGTYAIKTNDVAKTIRVEEYKRPSFEVLFEKVQDTYQPGDSINMKGKVQTFSGAPIRDLQVKYNITSYYHRWQRFFMTRSQSTQFNDSVTINSRGEFMIPMRLTVNEEDRKSAGYYTYVVEATVTTPSGETQSSSQSFFAGYRSMRLGVNFSEAQTSYLINLSKDHPVKVTFTAQNLNMQPVETQGRYRLYPYSGEDLEEQPLPPVFEGTFVANKEMEMSDWGGIPSGKYLLQVTASDNQGREVKCEKGLVLFSTNDTRPPLETNIWTYVENSQFDETSAAEICFATSDKDAYVMMDILGQRRFKDDVLLLSDTLVQFTIPYLPEYGDGVMVRFVFMKNCTAYIKEIKLVKKQPENNLTLSWETFRDKLRPGQKEEWRMKVEMPKGDAANAEVLATMYDASLDKIYAQSARQKNFDVKLPRRVPYLQWVSYNYSGPMVFLNFSSKVLPLEPFALDEFLMRANMDQHISIGYGSSTRKNLTGSVHLCEMSSVSDTRAQERSGLFLMTADTYSAEQQEEPIRSDFNETAFFYPQLRTNERGEVAISFTLPESLTRWNFTAYAHTKEMFTGMISEEVVAGKEFMLSPNMPRFVRVGDETSIAALLINLTGQSLSGNVTFTLFDPLTEKTICTKQQPFTVDADGQTPVSFTFTADHRYTMLGCRMVAKSGKFSDGEQHVLPVLNNREQVVEAIAMPVKGGETREFDLAHLFNNQSTTAGNKRLTLEFSGNPAWYAVQALPSLNLPQSDNAISLVSTYYANSLAAYILNSQPRVKAMFDAWHKQGGSKETFMSNLQKNQDVKAILLEETPWLLEATTEQERMKRVAALFDLNALQYNSAGALSRLANLQRKNGAISWFEGMPAAGYITLYVAEQLVRLQHLTGMPLEAEAQKILQQAFTYIDAMTLKEYEQVLERGKEGKAIAGPSTNALHYLYLTALSDREVPETNKKSHAYFIGKLMDETKKRSIARKAMASIALYHAGKKDEAKLLATSMRQYMTYKEDKGMFFDTGAVPAVSWWSLQLPVQVKAIEALSYTGEVSEVIEGMKLWLLSQKKTQQWNSPVATASAVYALLAFGDNLLESKGDVNIELGGKLYKTDSLAQTIPGVAYLKEVIIDPTVLNKAHKVTVKKYDAGAAWGAVYAQFEEDMNKVSSSAEGLSVQKILYVERLVNGQKELVPIAAQTPLTPGDRVVSRLILGVGERMDFVQLKDQRAVCFEPENNLSGYRHGDQVSYYVDVKDASTNFFFYTLQKGVYVLEHTYRVTRAGSYESGLTLLQSTYSPEYVSYAPSIKINVKP